MTTTEHADVVTLRDAMATALDAVGLRLYDGGVEAILDALPDGWTFVRADAIRAAEAERLALVESLAEDERQMSILIDRGDAALAEVAGMRALLEATADMLDKGQRPDTAYLRAATAAQPAAPDAERHEGRCDRCGGANVVWWADHELWNAAVRTDGADEWPFLCPSCFATVAEVRGVVTAHTVWKMVPTTTLKATPGAYRAVPTRTGSPVSPPTPAAPKIHVADRMESGARIDSNRLRYVARTIPAAGERLRYAYGTSPEQARANLLQRINAPEAEPERCAYILPSFTDPCRRPRESAVHDAVYGSKAHHSFTPEPR